MSEQEKSQGFMQELDQWTEDNVFDVLLLPEGEEPSELTDKTLEQVKKAIREKVLQSYKNGIKAGFAKATSRAAGKKPAMTR